MPRKSKTTVAEPVLPPHRWRAPDGIEYRWGGNSTCFCTGCRQLFSSHYAFDAHQRGGGQCQDPATMRRPSDNEPMFVQIPKPAWTPPHVWVRHVPGREPYTGPEN